MVCADIIFSCSVHISFRMIITFQSPFYLSYFNDFIKENQDKNAFKNRNTLINPGLMIKKLDILSQLHAFQILFLVYLSDFKNT